MHGTRLGGRLREGVGIVLEMGVGPRLGDAQDSRREKTLAKGGNRELCGRDEGCVTRGPSSLASIANDNPSSSALIVIENPSSSTIISSINQLHQLVLELRAREEWRIAEEDGLSMTIKVEEDGLLTTSDTEDGLSMTIEAIWAAQRAWPCPSVIPPPPPLLLSSCDPMPEILARSAAIPPLPPLRSRDPTPDLALTCALRLHFATVKKLRERRRIHQINSMCDPSSTRLPHHRFSPPSIASSSPH
ncbi:hypothetical protein M5K25_007741 [Dendrobium thyrsiflorum]|uniref:Uncharacterized protein n=1 Tax=Dendrobium thyrsiflorum TaxID=117978 RepID=A0ABD0VG43_DENTH